MNASSSEFLRQPCTCEGSNENCFRCGGWGYIDRIGEGRSTPTATGIGGAFSHPLPAGPRAAIAKKVRPQKRRVLWAWEEAEPMPRTVAPLPLLTAQDWLVDCPSCHSSVRRDRLARHLRKIHAQPTTLPEAKTAAPKNSACTQARNSRPSAPVNVLDAQFHDLNAPAPSQSSGRSVDRNIDATKDYYAAYRDNGQFGSHPSHDSYDDESSS